MQHDLLMDNSKNIYRSEKYFSAAGSILQFTFVYVHIINCVAIDKTCVKR